MESSIRLVGDVTECCKFSHERYGVQFYTITVTYKRGSDKEDHIPIILPWRQEFNLGDRVEIYGTIRTANVMEDNKKKLKVFVYADDITFTDCDYENDAFIFGSICKRNPIRETPSGKLIVDAIVAVNRAYGKSDYIPCVFWNNDAELIDSIYLGEELEISGKLQSRIYEKNYIQHEIVEMSVSQIA